MPSLRCAFAAYLKHPDRLWLHGPDTFYVGSRRTFVMRTAQSLMPSQGSTYIPIVPGRLRPEPLRQHLFQS
jgi:hypothetical protein